MPRNSLSILQTFEQIDTKYMTLPDGRKVSYLEVGDPQGIPVFYFHGSPSSRLEVLPLEEDAITHHLRMIAPDRPGIGESDMKKNYTLLDYAQDVQDMADYLEWDTFGVMGTSGGGTTVLSLAYACPDRLLFAMDISGWAPLSSDKELKKMIAPVDMFFGAIGIRFPWVFSMLFTPFLWLIKRFSTEKMVQLITGSLSKTDASFLKIEENRDVFQKIVQVGIEHRYDGTCRDALLRYLDWGFDIKDISFPIHIFHGTDDGFVPFAFCEWKTAQIKHSTKHVIKDVGHLTLMRNAGEIFKTIRQNLK